ncbi:MAG: sugar-binding domain-containing protein [Terracidiphilus sp.]|jgi:hypothetical protein
MQRRGFLGFAGRMFAGLGVAGPLLGPEALRALPVEDLPRPGGLKAQTLAFTLDGEWSILTDPGNVGRDQGWYRTAQPGAQATRVPSTIQETFPAYHGLAWYWHTFEAEPHPYAGGRYLLRFNEVNYSADVWVNGKHVGAHEGADTPFVLDATRAIRRGQNQLAVRVLNPTIRHIDGILLDETPLLSSSLAYLNGRAYPIGGILEPVELLLTPAIRITDLHVLPGWNTGKVRIRTTLLNTLEKARPARLRFDVDGAGIGQSVVTDAAEAVAKPGETVVEHELQIENHRLWDIQDPYLYRLSATIEAAGVEGSHEANTRFGFRDFRVVNGYFRLNGRRVLVRSTHTGNHTPVGVNIAPPGIPDLLRRDFYNARDSGFNTIRFLSGAAHPYELDLCDELGLLVYEEPRGSWLMRDSQQMKPRYEISLREMILRDRNHPCIAMWGMLNETKDGPVFREGASALSLLRSLDETRLVLLSSGRFDGHLEIGSLSNPGSRDWEFEWGKEGPGAGQPEGKYPSAIGFGDFHQYPTVPQTPEINKMMRTLGHDSKPVFLSEYGIGSMMDVMHEARMYEQAGVRKDAEDYVYMRSMADSFVAAWKQFGMDAVYPSPETLLQLSQRAMARHRLLGFNLIRSNPKFCGFNLTGMLDHGMTGEGVWRFWRDWKPGAFDAMQDGWAPVRWCLFVEPTHTYIGRPLTVEAVMANEDVLRPGSYPARFKIWGPNGVAWEHESAIRIPEVAKGEDGPLAVPVMKEEVTLRGPAGSYKLIPIIERDIAPPDTSWEFHLTDPASLPRLSAQVSCWGIADNVGSWLKLHGVTPAPLSKNANGAREVILIGDISAQSGSDDWAKLAARAATGSTVVFLSPPAFKRDKDPAGWMPTPVKGRVYEFYDWLYHKECVAKPHPVFEGLQGNGRLDWYYYGPVWPRYVFEGQDTPNEVMAAAFSAGYDQEGGAPSGFLLGAYKLGAGQFIVNAFPILENIDKHPCADRLLLNLIQYASGSAQGPAAPLPNDFEDWLKSVHYVD